MRSWWRTQVRKAESEITPRSRKRIGVTIALYFGGGMLMLWTESLLPIVAALAIGTVAELRTGKAWFGNYVVERSNRPIAYWIGISSRELPHHFLLGLLLAAYFVAA